MKLLVYVVSALLLFSCVSAGDDNTPDVQDALKYGINWIFEQAAKDHGVSDLNIDVTQVNSAKKWEDNGDTYYSFDVEAQNDDATISATFNVKCDSNGNLSVVDKWSYNIDKQNSDNNNENENEVEQPDAGSNVEIDVAINLEVEVEVEVEVDVVEEEKSHSDTEEENTHVVVEEENTHVDVEEENTHVVEEEDNNNNKCQQGNQVDASNVDNDSGLKDALNYGTNWIYQQAADKYGISNKDVQVTQINQICKWEDNGDTYYSFDVDTNNNDATISATFTVKCDSDGNFSVVNKWTYNIDTKSNNQENHNEGEGEVDIEVTVEEEENNTDNNTDNNNNKCEDIDASDIDNDSHLKDALVHGVNWIFEKAHDKFDISTEDIVVTKINKLCGWEDNGDKYYSFDVEATNKDEDTVDTSFNVKWDSNGDLTVVNEWKYVIHYNDNSDEENKEDCEDQGTDANDNIEQDTEVDVTITKCHQGDEVDISEINNNSDLKAALVHGITWIIERAHNKFGISTEDIVVTKINNLCGWEENGDKYYYFDVEATNQDGDTVDATFNVKCESNGDLRVVNEWKYVIHYGDNNEEENNVNENENENENENCEDQGTDSNENLEQEVEIDVEITINNCQQGDQVDASQVDNDSDLKDALVYGVDWIFQNAAHKYGVSDNNVDVNEINCICKWEDNGKTYYSFDLEAKNDDATIDAKFNIKNDGDGNYDVVNKWWYHINYKSNEEQQSNDYDSTENQETFVYETDNGQDVEIKVTVNDDN